MTEDQFIQLLQGFHDRQLSENELLSFLKAAEDPRFESLIGERLLEELAQIKPSDITDEARADKVWHNIYSAVQKPDRSGSLRLIKMPWIRYAAAVIIVSGIGAYVWTADKKPQQTQITGEIRPGRQGAILTLADGTNLTLDSLGNGRIAVQNGTQVLLKNGSLAYNAANATTLTYNTMTTPKGRQFNIELPDGSKAWLNAASSITYPTAFIGTQRSITISGEVYLEIAKDPKRPFKVKVNDRTEIEVLGTSFNTKAYSDDQRISTTLLDGAIRLNSNNQTQTLAPGQETIIQPKGEMLLIKKADIQKIMAWKNGLFNFQDEPLEEVMRQLERWYDIKVKYIGDPPKQKFFGELGRDLTLSQVIEALQEIGIQFSIEGRTLIVRH